MCKLAILLVVSLAISVESRCPFPQGERRSAGQTGELFEEPEKHDSYNVICPEYQIQQCKILLDACENMSDEEGVELLPLPALTPLPLLPLTHDVSVPSCGEESELAIEPEVKFKPEDEEESQEQEEDVEEKDILDEKQEKKPEPELEPKAEPEPEVEPVQELVPEPEAVVPNCSYDVMRKSIRKESKKHTEASKKSDQGVQSVDKPQNIPSRRWEKDIWERM